MATKIDPDCPSPEESDPEDQDSIATTKEERDVKPPTSNVADILKRLQSSGALLKKPKKEFRCVTCDEDFNDWEDLENHLIQHVSLPSVVLEKLPSDDEDNIPSEDENWSDEEDGTAPQNTNKTPQKVDISQLLKNKGISFKKPTTVPEPDSALNKLSGLGFTIKKGNTPIKQENEETEKSTPKPNDLMKKLGQLGGIKLKLKSDGGNKNSFKVVNGLKDFNASDDEEDGSGNEEQKNNESYDDEVGKDQSDDELNAPDNNKNSDSDNERETTPLAAKKYNNSIKSLQGKVVTPKPEPQSPAKLPAKPTGRPVIKQTPKRGANIAIRTSTQEVSPLSQNKEPSIPSIPTPPPEGRSSRTSSTSSTSTVVVKQEADTLESESSGLALFAGQIKNERISPPPPSDTSSTPMITSIKTEPDVAADTQPTPQTASLLPVKKQEETIIEINGDSNDEDDDCCVISTTPAPAQIVPKTEPLIPKTEPAVLSSYFPPSSCPSSVPSSTSVLNSRLTDPYTEKQHSFNWNAPESKPAIDMLKSTDDIFESLLSSATKKENLNMSDVSEYISLDTLGPQHSCDVCNTRFTSISLLDDHRRMTGHSKSLVFPTSHSSSMMPYSPNQSSSLLSSLLPVKQLADQVGKLVPSGMGNSGSGYQQNVMINIQAYPGAGMAPNQSPYNAYGTGSQSMHSGYQQPNSMYGATGHTMPGQYPNMSGQTYMDQQQPYGSNQQYQTPISQPSGYSPYPAQTPLQSMHQSVYGQQSSVGMNQQIPGQMMGPSHQPNQYVPSSSPGGTVKQQPGSNIKIQNVQTYTPAQISGSQTVPGQSIEMPPPPLPGPPGQIRMAPGASLTRPRMPGVRGPRPSIRPGTQVQSQIRGGNPRMRMPMKRPAGMTGGPAQKKRTDMLLPGKHDNEDCQVMAMQKQREGMPLIHSVQSTKDKINLGSQISITKKPVNKAAAMANVLASRGISVKQKQKSRSPSPERPLPHIPNLGSGMSIKHTSKSSNFSIPEAKVGGMVPCRICRKSFGSSSSLQMHMSSMHPQSKIPLYKCDECPASYPKSLQLQHHKRTFHNQTGANRELGLPVIDLSQQDNLERLSSLGIYSYIPLANRETTNGCFGIPIISVHNMQNGMTKGLQALGADGLLSLGPLKSLPNT